MMSNKSQDSGLKTQDSTQDFLAAAALIIFTLIVYLRAMRGLFLRDDDHHFSENPQMTAPGGLRALAMAQKVYESAAGILNIGLLRNPGDVELLTIRGVALIDCGRHNEALDSLQSADRKIPNDPEILNNMGLALEMPNCKTDAVKIYERAIEIKPDFAETYYNLARMLADMGDATGAQKVLGRGMAKLPKHPAFIDPDRQISKPKR